MVEIRVLTKIRVFNRNPKFQAENKMQGGREDLGITNKMEGEVRM